MNLGWHSFHHCNETERGKWQNPEVILCEIRLKPSQTFVEVGCGDGFFTVPAARIVGKSGKVYGLDTDSEAIRYLREKAKKEGLTNLVLKVGKTEELILCEGCADFVFFGNVLHDFDEPSRVLLNAKVMLKPSRCLVDVDWKKEPMKFGPPLTIRFSEQKAISLTRNAGFKIDAVKKSGAYHYMITAYPV
jgi:ubiquinone/menaquinone biosynthesis C-methylase UbiE